MIFIRNSNGSHNPNETMNFDDFACTTDVLTQWVLMVSNRYIAECLKCGRLIQGHFQTISSSPAQRLATPNRCPDPLWLRDVRMRCGNPRQWHRHPIVGIA